MATVEQFAIMATNAYGSARPANEVPDPVGWTTVKHVTDTSGLEYSVIRNDADANDIVIAYAGTDTSLPGAIPDWATNLVASLGLPVVSQLLVAAQAYVATRLEHPTANITFTGHSLGGGLASVMALWFADRTYKRPYVGSGTGRGELQSGG